MKFIINKYGRGSVFFTFLLSYIVVLLVPLSIGSISYIKAAQTVKEEAERYNRAILRQVSQAVDS